jgi:hypothetical protein
MLSSGENCKKYLRMFFFWHLKVMLFIPSFVEWLIWMLKNSN